MHWWNKKVDLDWMRWWDNDVEAEDWRPTEEDVAELAREHADCVSRRDMFVWMAAAARRALVQSDPGCDLNLRRGESALYAVDAVDLVEPQRGPTTYVGASNGVSLRVMRGVSYRMGSSRGVAVRGEQCQTIVDRGSLAITNQRVVFTGGVAAREWEWEKVLDVDHLAGQAVTLLPVSNRQKTSGIAYEHFDMSGWMRTRFSFDLGLRYYRGEIDAYIEEIDTWVEMAELRCRASKPDALESTGIMRGDL